MIEKGHYCKYALGRPVLIDGVRLTTITKDELTMYARSRGGYMDARAAILREETAKMQKILCSKMPAYPPCEVTGVSTSVEARVDELSKTITAYFVCRSCG